MKAHLVTPRDGASKPSTVMGHWSIEGHLPTLLARVHPAPITHGQQLEPAHPHPAAAAVLPTCSSSATSSILWRLAGSAQAFLLATRRVVDAKMVSTTCLVAGGSGKRVWVVWRGRHGGGILLHSCPHTQLLGKLSTG